jgi:predicted nucleic acid-binding protein
MLKIILDTNVIIASRRSRNGASHRLVSMIGSGHFELVMSVTLAFEYEAILKRQVSEIGMSPGDIDDFVGFI